MGEAPIAGLSFANNPANAPGLFANLRF